MGQCTEGDTRPNAAERIFWWFSNCWNQSVWVWKFTTYEARLAVLTAAYNDLKKVLERAKIWKWRWAWQKGTDFVGKWWSEWNGRKTNRDEVNIRKTCRVKDEMRESNQRQSEKNLPAPKRNFSFHWTTEPVHLYKSTYPTLIGGISVTSWIFNQFWAVKTDFCSLCLFLLFSKGFSRWNPSHSH